MKTIRITKNLFFPFSIMVMLSACGGGSGGQSSYNATATVEKNSEVTENIVQHIETDDHAETGGIENDVIDEVKDSSEDASHTCQKGPAKIEGRIVNYLNGKPLANVEVSIGGCITKTDENGWYSLKDIAENERAAVTFKADGFYRNSTIIYLKQYVNGTKTVSPNFLSYPLDPYDNQESYQSNIDVTLTTQDNASISIPAGVYQDMQGNEYMGDVKAEIAYEDVFTSKGRFEFLGTYEGVDANGETVMLRSYGMMVVDIKDSDGRPLKIVDNASIKFPAPKKSAAETIPLWYYDYDKGIWIEEGYATRQDDGSYVGEISHLGAWSLNAPVVEAPGRYIGRITYEDGTPARGIRILAMGENWIQGDLTTDSEGKFEIKVVPNSDFTIRAYDFVKKFEAVFKEVIPGIGSGETFEDKR